MKFVWRHKHIELSKINLINFDLDTVCFLNETENGEPDEIIYESSSQKEVSLILLAIKEMLIIKNHTEEIK